MPKIRLPRVDGTYLCWDCGQWKPASEFVRGKRGKPYSYCFVCSRRHSSESHRRRKQIRNNPPAAEKKCPDCRVTKPGGEFYPNPVTRDGLAYCCRACNRERGMNRKERIKNAPPIPIPDGQKRCHRCQTVKPVEAFSKNRGRPDHVDVYCKECSKQLQHPRYIKHTYGLSADAYATLLEQQGGVCAICGEPETVVHLGKIPRLSVDHRHDETATVRGLLCYACNHLVGHIERAGADRVRMVFMYLQKHSS